MSASLNDRPNKVEVAGDAATVIVGGAGTQGEPGVGVPAGGATNDILVKSSGTDYDTEWTDAPVVDSITLDTTAGDTLSTVGQTLWDDTAGSAATLLKGGNVTAIMGQTIYQRIDNTTGAPLTKGQVVYLTGSSGQKVTVALALADSETTSSKTFGVVAETIANSNSGFVMTEGLLQGFATNLLTEGALIWLSPTVAGGMTTTRPTAPDNSVMVGVCVKSGSGTSGSVLVKVQNGYELDELHDVLYTGTPATGDVLTRTAGGLWTNAAPAESGIPATIIDAKGDLIVGTAADTAARLAVGTNGHVLTADSAQAGGVAWSEAPSASAGFSQHSSGSYLGPFGATIGTTFNISTSVANSNDRIVAQPIVVNTAATIANAVLWVNGAADVGSNSEVRMAVYSTGNGPASLIRDLGTANIESTGLKTITGSSTTLTRGVYWLVMFTKVAGLTNPSFRAYTNTAVSSVAHTTGYSSNQNAATGNRLMATLAYPGSAPSSLSSTVWTTSSVSLALALVLS